MRADVPLPGATPGGIQEPALEGGCHGAGLLAAKGLAKRRLFGSQRRQQTGAFVPAVASHLLKGKMDEKTADGRDYLYRLLLIIRLLQGTDSTSKRRHFRGQGQSSCYRRRLACVSVMPTRKGFSPPQYVVCRKQVSNPDPVVGGEESAVLGPQGERARGCQSPRWGPSGLPDAL